MRTRTYEFTDPLFGPARLTFGHNYEQGMWIAFRTVGGLATGEADGSPAPSRREGAVPPERAFVVAASCDGADALSRQLGFRLAAIGVATEAERFVDALSASSFAASTTWALGEPYFDTDAAWFEWSRLEMRPGPGAMSRGIEVRDGVLSVLLPSGLALSDFDQRLAETMRFLAFDEVARTPGAVRRRASAGLPLTVLPRYSPPRMNDPEGVFRPARRLYAFDGSEPAVVRLALLVEATIARALADAPRLRRGGPAGASP